MKNTRNISYLSVFLAVALSVLSGCQKKNGEGTYEAIYEMRVASFVYYHETSTTAKHYNLYQVHPEGTDTWGNKWFLGTMAQDGRFEYEEGYEYVFKVTTVWENQPDIGKADGGPITQPKYELLSKTQTDTYVKDEDIWKAIPSETYYW